MCNKAECKNHTLRCYPQGECPLKEKCLWASCDGPEIAEQLSQSKQLGEDFMSGCNDRNS